MKARLEPVYTRIEGKLQKVLYLNLVPDENGDIEIEENTIMNADLFSKELKKYNEKIKKENRMDEELKPCSWCGIIPIKKDGNPPYAEHRCKALKNIWFTVPLYAWQSRPIEDALTAERNGLAEKVQLATTGMNDAIRIYHKRINETHRLNNLASVICGRLENTLAEIEHVKEE
jgi:hypothetical protein